MAAAAAQVEVEVEVAVVVGVCRLFDKNEPGTGPQGPRGGRRRGGALRAKALWALIEQPNKCAKL